MQRGPGHERFGRDLVPEMAVRGFPHDASARGLLAGSFRGHPWLIFPSVPGVLHRGNCADSSRPIGIVTAAHESCSPDVAVSQFDRPRHARPMADFLLLRTLTERC